MVARVNYSREGAGDLLRYIDRGAERGVRSEIGRRLSNEDKERFIRRSEERSFTRSVVLSVPDHATENLSDRAMERDVQRTINEQLQDAPGARYVYGIHEDTDHRHAHVAIIGNEYELTWDRDDINRLRERANERFIERHRPAELEVEPERDRDRDSTHGQSTEVERGDDWGIER